MAGCQRNRRSRTHGQTSDCVAVRVDTKLILQVDRQLLSQEGLPLLNLDSFGSHSRGIPVGVEGAIASSRRNQSDVVIGEGLSNVARPNPTGRTPIEAPQTVEHVQGRIAATSSRLNLNRNIAVHSPRENLAVLNPPVVWIPLTAWTQSITVWISTCILRGCKHDATKDHRNRYEGSYDLHCEVTTHCSKAHRSPLYFRTYLRARLFGGSRLRELSLFCFQL